MRRCVESVNRFSPAKTGFRPSGTRYCDASRPSAAVPQKRFAKSSASKRATSDESDASWGDAEQSLLASDGTGFAWVDGSDAPPSDPMEMAVHIGLAEVLSAIKRNTPVAYICCLADLVYFHYFLSISACCLAVTAMLDHPPL